MGRKKGYKRTIETTQKIVNGRRSNEQWNSENARKNMSKAQLGIKHSKKWKESQHLALKKWWNKNRETIEVKKRNKHISNSRKGFVMTEITKEKISNAHTGKTLSKRTKEKMRIAKIAYITKHSMPITIGKYEAQILDKLEYCLGYPILRQYKVGGYSLDGYCAMLNLAIEVDEKHHMNKKNVKKDFIRENNIKNKINCKFLRLNQK